MQRIGERANKLMRNNKSYSNDFFIVLSFYVMQRSHRPNAQVRFRMYVKEKINGVAAYLLSN